MARLPSSLSPNAITHAGHLINLTALLALVLTGADRGWPLLVAGVLVQLYIVCDNADGTHARRTGQSSPYGELLDHGLDTLNVAYIACMSAYALALPPMWWVLLVLLVTAASAFTFLRADADGNVVLGRLNQQESGALLTIVLFVGAVVGRDVWASTIVFPGITAQMIVLATGGFSLVFTMGRVAWSVRRQRGARAVLPVVLLVVFNAAVFVLAAMTILRPVVALWVVMASNTWFAVRMLARVSVRARHRSASPVRRDRWSVRC